LPRRSSTRIVVTTRPPRDSDLEGLIRLPSDAIGSRTVPSTYHDGFPVLAGRLHHDGRHALVDQPGGERLELAGERPERADLGVPPAGVTRHPDADDHLVLADVELGTALVYDLHRATSVLTLRCPAGPTESTTLKHVQAAKSSWCREGPRFSLFYGLSRTKGSRALPGTPPISSFLAAEAMGVCFICVGS
jgi:hypothetical protein